MKTRIYAAPAIKELSIHCVESGSGNSHIVRTGPRLFYACQLERYISIWSCGIAMIQITAAQS